MNAKVVAYLVRTDFRRLWPAVMAWWLMVAAAASPYWIADLERISGMAAMLDGPGGSSWSVKEFFPTHAFRGMSGMGDVITWFASFLKPMLVVLCALIGIAGGKWCAARPVRKSEWFAVKAIETMLFVALPVPLAVGINLAVHGFSAWNVVLSSAKNLTPLLAAMVLCGVLCGTFRRWALWMTGFWLFFLVCLLVVRKHWLSDGGIDVWGGLGSDSLRDWIICAGLGILVMLKGRFRDSFGVLAVGWVVIVGAILLGLRFQPVGAPFSGIPRDSRLEKTDFPFPSVHLRMYREDALDVVSGPIGPKSEGGSFVEWWTTGDLVLSRDGVKLAGRERIAEMNTRASLRGHGKRYLGFGGPVPYMFEEDALMAAMPADAGNLVSDLERQQLPVPFLGFAKAVRSDDEVLKAPVDVQAGINAIRYRYEKIAEVKVGETIQGDDRGARFLMRSGFSSGVRLDFAKLVEGEREVDYAADQIAVVLSLPDKGIAFRMKAVKRKAEGRMLAGCRFFVTRHQMTREALERMSRLYGSANVSNGKILVFAMRLEGKADRVFKADKIQVVDGRKSEPIPKLPERIDSDNVGFFRTYLQERPDPGKCTETEAGRWIYRVLSLSRAEDSWVARELAPFVTAFPELALKMPEHALVRREMTDAIVEGFPAERKDALVSRLREEKSEPAFATWFRIAERRGWKDEVLPIAKERIGKTDVLSDVMTAIAVDCQDPAFHPKILARVREGISWPLYVRIREIPEISKELDQAVKDYEGNLGRMTAGNVKARKIPASRGSRTALKAILDVLAARARSGEAFDSWDDVNAVIRFPKTGQERRNTVDYRYADLTPDDFEWSEFLQQWLPDESIPF